MILPSNYHKFFSNLQRSQCISRSEVTHDDDKIWLALISCVELNSLCGPELVNFTIREGVV